PSGCPTAVTLSRCSVSNSRPSNRACGSPAHGSPTSFTAGIRSVPPPRRERPRRDDGSQADQAQLVARLEQQSRPPDPATSFVPLGDQLCQPHLGVVPDLLEVPGGVAVPEEPGPAR